MKAKEACEWKNILLQKALASWHYLHLPVFFFFFYNSISIVTVKFFTI